MKRLSKNEGVANRRMMVGNNPAETSTSTFPNNVPGHRWYECKTCGKKFDTFQALGGHQGTHRKLKPIDDDVCMLSLQIAPSPMLRLHQCKMCTKKFDNGQALGGHMRQHKLEKDLILMGRDELLWRQLVAEEKLGSNLVVENVVQLGQQKVEEDEHDRVKTELLLAAKELRLGI
ncbi:unnamed protein product [Lactuca virosa]|uniref:C2H2-type domain-containing protein n=1 Tax=Lactuca virosa TaxID=75947 RepID=A0AAU9LMB3_9ASTR|nr:unnamed protein product [Lactuca virosa]